MKKKNYLLILMAILLVVLTACGGKDKDPDPTPAPTLTGSWELVSASGTSDGLNYATMLEQTKNNNGSYVLTFTNDKKVDIKMTSNGEELFSDTKEYSQDGNKLIIGGETKQIELTTSTLTIKDENATLTFNRK